MAGYIGANTSSVTNNQNAAERRKKFTFTANTTVLSGLNFAPQKIHIFHNGIRLVRTTDYTEAADGKSVTLVNAAQAGDEVVAITFAQDPASNPAYTDADVDAHLLTAGVTLDATNDRVGINESTPTGSLHVKGTSTAHGKIILEAGGSGGSANNNYMEFNKHDGTKLGEIEIGESVSNGGSILLKTTPSGGSATTRMTINHDGIVTKPNTPHMLAQGFSARVSGTDRNVFHTVTTNTGNNWNNTTGKFTCPVDGTYLVTAFSGYTQASDYIGLGIGYNGSVLSYGWMHPNLARHAQSSVTIMKNASANDYFYYYLHPSYTTPISSSGNEHHSHLSVYLLG